MNKITLALIAGGESSERVISLDSSKQVYKYLNKDKYNIICYDPKYDLELLIKNASKIDVAFIALHGSFGEDGTIQGLLDRLNIPYQGSGVLASALCFNKLASKMIYEQQELLVPNYISIYKNEKIELEICINKIGLPLVVKPAQAGSSIGMSVVKSKDSLKKAIDNAFIHDNTVIIESYIKGIELTCGVIGNDNLLALPVVEIIPDSKCEFFDYKAKYTKGLTKEICPAQIDEKLSKIVKKYSKHAHKALFCRGYSRTDMILCDQKIYIIETNTIPGMTSTSLFPLAAKTAGISFEALLDKLIELGLKEHNRL